MMWGFGHRPVQRVVDITVAGVGGLILAPVGIVLAVLVRWKMGRPLLFRQTRTGLSGTEFSIVKFRSMLPPAYPDQPDSERDTTLGNRLRSTSLDELPQLWNVLRGDMSLIGPRPTLPEQVQHYSARQRGRLVIRPGLTGWAQVNGRNSISWPARIELDLWYIEHRTLWLDLRIVGRTLLRLVRPEGILGEGGVNPGFPHPGLSAESPACHSAESPACHSAESPACHSAESPRFVVDGAPQPANFDDSVRE